MSQMSKRLLVLLVILVIAIGSFYAGYQLGSMKSSSASLSPSMFPQIPPASGPSLQTNIIGKWEKFADTGGWFISYPDPEIIQFFNDGTVTMRSKQAHATGELVANYKLIDDDHLRIDISGGLDSVLFKVSISREQLILEGSSPFGVKRYKRIP